MSLSVTDTYTDINTADNYLSLKDDWQVLPDEKKQDALLWARYFIDENFYIDNVNDVSDYTLVPNELQFATSLLAYDASLGDLFSRHTSLIVKEKSVKAGSVQSSKKFLASKADKLPSSYSKVKVLLSSMYSSKDGVHFLVRA